MTGSSSKAETCLEPLLQLRLRTALHKNQSLFAMYDAACFAILMGICKRVKWLQVQCRFRE